MKTKIIYLLTCMLIISLLISLNAMAQQQNSVPGKDFSPVSSQHSAVFTYRVFEAPNKMYGYDILKNGKGIFHQPAAVVQSANPSRTEKGGSQNAGLTINQTSQNVALSKKEHSENAALLSIEKIKAGMPPANTQEELKKIVGQ